MSELRINHHPIFAAFSTYVGPLAAGVLCEWIGDMYRPAWVGAPEYPGTERFEPQLPAFNNEYFEWIELLEAAASARGRGRFVMLELGAGYGRWGVRGALAAKQCGICDIDVRFVEAEPQHAAWLADAIALNQLQDIKTTVIEAAVSYAAEPVPFAVTYEGLDARSWYGQAIWVAANQRTARTYFGRPVYRTVGDVDQIMVEPVTFESIIADVERVDHVDMDLQGAERELIPAAIATFSEKVARVHIGTHGAEIEDLVRRTFLEAGWTPGWDFAGLRCQDTPYGPIEFEDGVQTWRNPRLI